MPAPSAAAPGRVEPLPGPSVLHPRLPPCGRDPSPALSTRGPAGGTGAAVRPWPRLAKPGELWSPSGAALPCPAIPPQRGSRPGPGCPARTAGHGRAGHGRAGHGAAAAAAPCRPSPFLVRQRQPPTEEKFPAKRQDRSGCHRRLLPADETGRSPPSAPSRPRTHPPRLGVPPEALTFLHRMEGVVGLYELDGVSDFLALEDVVIEVQIRYRLLEHLVVLGSIAFENGT